MLAIKFLVFIITHWVKSKMARKYHVLVLLPYILNVISTHRNNDMTSESVSNLFGFLTCCLSPKCVGQKVHSPT